MQDKVARLRQLMSEAMPRTLPPQSSAESDAWRAFQFSEFNTCRALPEQTVRARSLRDINRIAIWYSWASEIQQALDAANCGSLGEMDDTQIAALHDRMKQLESCAQEGLGSPYAPPAT